MKGDHSQVILKKVCGYQVATVDADIGFGCLNWIGLLESPRLEGGASEVVHKLVRQCWIKTLLKCHGGWEIGNAATQIPVDVTANLLLRNTRASRQSPQQEQLSRQRQQWSSSCFLRISFQEF